MSDTGSADAVTKTGYLKRKRDRRGDAFTPAADISKGIGRRAMPEENPDLWNHRAAAPEYSPQQIDRGNSSRKARERVAKRRYS